MAQAAVRLGDQCTGHGCFPPRANISASGNVFINSIGAHRVGDGWAVHCCGPVCHGGSQATGSSTVNLPFLAYKTAFTYFDTSRASAIAVAIVILVLPVYFIFLRMTKV